MKIRLALMLFFVIILWTGSSSFKPSGESEMARLMKQMLQYIKTERANMDSDKPTQPYPKSFHKIKSAKVTPGKKLSVDHEDYLHSFFQELEKYRALSTTTKRKEQFNLLVNTCVTCHKRECPGPVETIQDNLIKE